jgi:hypothetical protein
MIMHELFILHRNRNSISPRPLVPCSNRTGQTIELIFTTVKYISDTLFLQRNLRERRERNWEND